MKKLDVWDLMAALFTLVLGAGAWLIYMPAALILVGTIGLVFAVIAAGGRR